MVTASLLSDRIKAFFDTYRDYSLISRLKKKYPDVLLRESSPFVDGPGENDDMLCFDDDWERSVTILKAILENAKRLKERYCKVLTNSDNNTVYFKTIDKLIDRLEKMTIDKPLDSCKAADKLLKVINSTIVKNFSCERLEKNLRSFMRECGFKCIELRIGKVIDDEDLKYIDTSNCIYEEVKDKRKHNTIISKSYDSYVYKYFDSEENEYYERVIPGAYSIGSWKE